MPVDHPDQWAKGGGDMAKGKYGEEVRVPTDTGAEVVISNFELDTTHQAENLPTHVQISAPTFTGQINLNFTPEHALKVASALQHYAALVFKARAEQTRTS